MKIVHRESDTFYSDKRTRKSNKRKLLKVKEQQLQILKSNQLTSNFGTRSRVIRMLGARSQKALPNKKHKIEFILSECFSILENPEETIQQLMWLANTLDKDPNIIEIKILFSKLKKYNLAANALLDLIVVEKSIEKRSRKSRKRLQVKGNYPTDESVKLFIKSMGIIKHLEIQHEAPTSEESEKIIFFDFRNPYYYRINDGKKAGLKDKKIQEFVDYVDTCLNERNLELSEHGQQELVNYTGEILSNAEEHSGFSDWTIQGYLDKSGEYPVCELVIFNFGKSIAESIIETRKTNTYLNDHIGPYVNRHLQSGFFGTSWSEEDLCTVIALQGNVSSKNFNVTDTRGQGTIDMIRFFEEINRVCSKDEKSKMAILSGSTHILFDGTYSLLDRENAGPIIAFNSKNNLLEKPDQKYVRNLKDAYFPGTIISIKFPIKSSSLFEETKDDEHDN